MEPITSISPEVMALQAEVKRLQTALDIAHKVLAMYEDAEVSDETPTEYLDD